MKNRTILFDDGTEPTIISRFCCDGLCNQGRDCPGPAAPAPAEACTELGVDDNDPPAPILLFGIAIVLVVGLIAFITGYFA